MSAEEKEIYHHVFEKKGLAPGDFVRLIAKAKREVIPKGEKLVDETKCNTRYEASLLFPSLQSIANLSSPLFSPCAAFVESICSRMEWFQFAKVDRRWAE